MDRGIQPLDGIPVEAQGVVVVVVVVTVTEDHLVHNQNQVDPYYTLQVVALDSLVPSA